MKRPNGRPRCAAVVCAIAVAVGTLGLTVAGGTASATVSRATSPDPNATVKYAVTGVPSQFDPIAVVSEILDLPFLGPIYDRLTNVKADGTIGPELATSWTEAPDGLKWTFKIRSGAVFQDNTPITPDAIVANFKRALASTSAVQKTKLANVADVASSGDSVVFTMKKQDVLLPALVANVGSGIASPAAFGQLAQNPVGSGPWKFASLGANTVNYTAFSGYWNKSAIKATKLSSGGIPDATARVNALKTGQLNTALAAYGNYADWQSLGSGFKVSRVQAGNLMDITINTSKAPFNNPDVTKAISMAIDRAAINKSLFNGECMPTSAPLPVGAGSSAAANKQWKYSVKDAKALLAKAGTPNVTINAITIPGIWDTVGQAMRPMLAEAGITLNLRTVSPNELRSTYASGATDAIMLQLNSEVDPLIFLRNNYLTFQMLGTPPAEVKDSIDAMASMQIGSPKRTAELAKVNMYIARNPIHLVICNISNLYAASTKVQGIQDMGWAKTGGGNTDPRGLWVAR